MKQRQVVDNNSNTEMYYKNRTNIYKGNMKEDQNLQKSVTVANDWEPVPDDIETTIQEDFIEAKKNELRDILEANHDSMTDEEVDEAVREIDNTTIDFIDLDGETIENIDYSENDMNNTYTEYANPYDIDPNKDYNTQDKKIEFVNPYTNENETDIVDTSVWSNPETAYQEYEALSDQDKEGIKLANILEQKKIVEQKKEIARQRKLEEENAKLAYLKENADTILNEAFTHPEYKEQNIGIISKLYGLGNEKVHSANECVRAFGEQGVKIEKWRIGVAQKKFLKTAKRLENKKELEKNAELEKQRKLEEENTNLAYLKENADTILNEAFPHSEYKEQNIGIINKLYGFGGEKVHSTNECIRAFEEQGIKIEKWRIGVAQKKFLKTAEKLEKIVSVLNETFSDKYAKQNIEIIKKLFGLGNEKIHRVDECVSKKVPAWRVIKIKKQFLKATEAKGIEMYPKRKNSKNNKKTA